MRERCRWQMKRPNEGAAVEILRAYSELKISGTAIGQVSSKATDEGPPFMLRSDLYGTPSVKTLSCHLP